MKYTDLIQTQVAMSLCNCLAETVREGVEHAVMGMHGWQAVLIQLISHNAHQLLHALIIVSPVTYNLRTRAQYDMTCHTKMKTHTFKTFTYLQTVSQVTVSIREVRLELQGSAVRCNRFRNVPRILQEERDVI